MMSFRLVIFDGDCMIDVDVVWSVRLQYALELNYVKTNGYTMDVERGGGAIYCKHVDV